MMSCLVPPISALLTSIFTHVITHNELAIATPDARDFFARVW